MAKSKFSVLQVGKYYPPHMGGIETHLQTLCRGLRNRIDLRVVVANDARHRVVDRVDGIEVTRLGTWANLAGAPICPELVRTIRASKADIVHLHLPNPAAVLAYLVSGHRGRLVVSYHSDVVRQRVLDSMFRPILNSALRRADAIVAATPPYIDSSEILSLHREHCTVIPYGIDLEPFRSPCPRALELRARYDGPLILAVGRLVYYKGFETLIDSMEGVPAQLLIVGSGPLRGELQARIERRGLMDRVALVGGVDDTAPYYHAADVFVLPSIARSEAFGIVQLEAMASGKPVINTGLASGVPFVSRHDESGLTVPPGDSAALRLAILRLIEDPALRARYGAAALLRVEKEFSEATMVERTLALYESILGLQGVSTASAVAEPPLSRVSSGR